MKKRKNGKKIRKLPGIYAGNDRLDEKYLELLSSGDYRNWLYIYRAENDRRVGSYIRKCHPFPELEDFLQNEFGGGEFAIFIRKGDGTMLFSGVVSIGAPLNRQSRK